MWVITLMMQHCLFNCHSFPAKKKNESNCSVLVVVREQKKNGSLMWKSAQQQRQGCLGKPQKGSHYANNESTSLTDLGPFIWLEGRRGTLWVSRWPLLLVFIEWGWVLGFAYFFQVSWMLAEHSALFLESDFQVSLETGAKMAGQVFCQ